MAGTRIFDPIGDPVGKSRDVVVVQRAFGRPPRVVGMVVEVPGKRRVFLPMTRVTAIDPGQIIATGLLNMRRFEKRTSEVLVLGEMLDRRVTFLDGSGDATIQDVAVDQQPTGDWEVSKLFVQRVPRGSGFGRLRRRGETLIVDWTEVTSEPHRAVAQGAENTLAAYDDMRPADVADALHEMDAKRQLEIARALDDHRLADVLQEMPEDEQVSILEALDKERAADVLEEMDPDDAADVLGELSQEKIDEFLDLMEPDEADDVRRLMSYDENTAGGLMTTEPVVLPPEASIAEALAHVRKAELPTAIAAVLYVCRPPLEPPTGRLLGIVHIQKLLRYPPHESVGTIIDSEPVLLSPDASFEDVARMLAAYDLISLPVVDEAGRLLGAVTIDDVLDHMLPATWRSEGKPEQRLMVERQMAARRAAERQMAERRLAARRAATRRAAEEDRERRGERRAERDAEGENGKGKGPGEGRGWRRGGRHHG